MNDLQSIRRSDTRLAWSYAIFVLKDGSTVPALHFHSGGINQLISALQRFIWLTRYVYFILFQVFDYITSFKFASMREEVGFSDIVGSKEFVGCAGGL